MRSRLFAVGIAGVLSAAGLTPVFHWLWPLLGLAGLAAAAAVGGAIVMITLGWHLVVDPARRAADAAVRDHADALQAVEQAVDEVLFRVDDSLHWLALNPAWERLTGRSVAETLGTPVLDAVAPEDRDRVRATLSGVGCEPDGGPIECRVATASGGFRTVLLRLRRSPPRGRGASVRAGILRDITALRTEEGAHQAQIHQLEAGLRELAEARDRAAQSARAKGEFLASMSHEVRTPIGGVLGLVGLLLDTPLDPEQRDWADGIRRSAAQLLGVANDILDLSRIEAGQLAIEPISFALRIAVEDVAEMLAPEAQEKRLELMVRVAPEVPQYVIGDPGRLRQILTNLVGNAVKYTRRGHVLVNVDLTGEAPGRLRFAVEDTGEGIPSARLAEIFDRFTQLDIRQSRRLGGNGLGLAISRQLAGLMGGRIGVESQVGEGSTFWVELPLPADPAARPLAPPRGSLVGVRVLVVDPETTSRQVLVEQLDSLGLVPGSAGTGAGALAELEGADRNGSAYDLVVTTGQLPDMEGEALGRLIKGDVRLRRAGLFFLATHGRPGDARRVSEAGFAGYLVKPLRHVDLHDALAHVWDTRDQDPPPPLITRHSLAEARAAGRPGPTPSQRRRDSSVLVVEDNPVNRRLTVSLLERLECRVEAAEDGRRALQAVESRCYDVVFMDVQMPTMDGYEATRRIRALPGPAARVPIVALTAHAMRGDRERCLEAGMDDYLSKPIRGADLAAVLDRWIGVGEPVDPDVLTRLWDRDERLLAELVALFLRDTPRRLAELSRAASAGELGRAEFLAHAIKGAARAIGAGHLATLAEGVERHARGGVLRHAADLVQRLAREFERVRLTCAGMLQEAEPIPAGETRAP